MRDEWVIRHPADLGRAMRHFRDRGGVTQAELADQVGIHRSYLSDLERGRSTEQTERAFRVLRRLGLEIVVRPRGGR